MGQHRKLFLGLIFFTTLASWLLWQQIRQASNTVTRAKQAPLVDTDLTNIPVKSTDPILGNPGAPLTIVEFMDFGNKKAKKAHAIISTFVMENPTQARLIWKDNPVPGFFSDYTLTHQGSLCAKEQNKFWPFVESALQSSSIWRETGLKSVAEKTNLSVDLWQLCLTSEATKQTISEATILAKQLSINHLPAIFINNKRINLDEDVDLKQMLELLIEK